MRRLLLSALLLVLVATRVAAQATTPNNHLGWTQTGQTAAVASGATYNYYADGVTTPNGQLTGVTCTTAGADASCTSNIPALSVGAHTIAITQVISGAESAKSNVLSFTLVVVVTPSQLKVVP